MKIDESKEKENQMTDTRKIAEEIAGDCGWIVPVDDIEKALTEMRNKTIQECLNILTQNDSNWNEIIEQIKSLLSEPERSDNGTFEKGEK